jgi:uncharacterized small protein (DUF1192 family)
MAATKVIGLYDGKVWVFKRTAATQVLEHVVANNTLPTLDDHGVVAAHMVVMNLDTMSKKDALHTMSLWRAKFDTAKVQRRIARLDARMDRLKAEREALENGKPLPPKVKRTKKAKASK